MVEIHFPCLLWIPEITQVFLCVFEIKGSKHESFSIFIALVILPSLLGTCYLGKAFLFTCIFLFFILFFFLWLGKALKTLSTWRLSG